MSEKPTIVLVHGGFVDGSGWQAVHQLLTRPGPRRAHRAEPDPVARRATWPRPAGSSTRSTGPSCSSATPTVAPSSPRLAPTTASQSLVYIAAFAPDKGESVSTLIADPPPGAPVPPILPPYDGFLLLDRDEVRRIRSPPTCRPARPPSWPTRRSPGASTRSPAASANPPGGPGRAGTSSPPTTG